MLALFHDILCAAGSLWLCSHRKGCEAAVDIDDWALPSSDDEDNAQQKQEQVVPSSAPDPSSANRNALSCAVWLSCDG